MCLSLLCMSFFTCTKQHANKILVEYRMTNFGKLKNSGNPLFCLSDFKIIMRIDAFRRMFSFFVLFENGLPLSLVKVFDEFRIYLIQKTCILLCPFVRVKFITFRLSEFCEVKGYYSLIHLLSPINEIKKSPKKRK